MSRQGSKTPVRDATPEWVEMLPREVEKKVLELAKSGIQPAQIGLVLRDSYGVPSVHELCGKKVGQIIGEAGMGGSMPVDLQNLVRRAINLKEHIDGNRRDQHNLRGLELMEARIRKLAKYYQAKGQLAVDWKYTRDGARLLVD